MLNNLSKTQISFLTAAGVALLYLIISIALHAAFKSELRSYLEGALASDPRALTDPDVLRNRPEFGFLLRVMMLPIPATIGNGLFWPFLVQAVFIFGYLVAFIRSPIIATWGIGLIALFVVMLLLGSGLLKGLGATLIFGLPMIGILSAIGLMINQRLIPDPSS